MKTENDHMVHFLLNLSPIQRVKVIKVLGKTQITFLLEIIYNVMEGVCPISESDKIVIGKRKNLIRRLISTKVGVGQRKSILVRLDKYLPLFLKAYVQYVTRTDSDS